MIALYRPSSQLINGLEIYLHELCVTETRSSVSVLLFVDKWIRDKSTWIMYETETRSSISVLLFVLRPRRDSSHSVVQLRQVDTERRRYTMYRRQCGKENYKIYDHEGSAYTDRTWDRRVQKQSPRRQDLCRQDGAYWKQPHPGTQGHYSVVYMA